MIRFSDEDNASENIQHLFFQFQTSYCMQINSFPLLLFRILPKNHSLIRLSTAYTIYTLSYNVEQLSQRFYSYQKETSVFHPRHFYICEGVEVKFWERKVVRACKKHNDLHFRKSGIFDFISKLKRLNHWRIHQ